MYIAGVVDAICGGVRACPPEIFTFYRIIFDNFTMYIFGNKLSSSLQLLK